MSLATSLVQQLGSSRTQTCYSWFCFVAQSTSSAAVDAGIACQVKVGKTHGPVLLIYCGCKEPCRGKCPVSGVLNLSTGEKLTRPET